MSGQEPHVPQPSVSSLGGQRRGCAGFPGFRRFPRPASLRVLGGFDAGLFHFQQHRGSNHARKAIVGRLPDAVAAGCGCYESSCSCKQHSSSETSWHASTPTLTDARREKTADTASCRGRAAECLAPEKFGHALAGEQHRPARGRACLIRAHRAPASRNVERLVPETRPECPRYRLAMWKGLLGAAHRHRNGMSRNG